MSMESLLTKPLEKESNLESLLNGFFDSLFRNDVWIIGLASESAKQQLYLEDHDLDLLQTFTVFGDPMLKIQDGPMVINIPILHKMGQD